MRGGVDRVTGERDLVIAGEGVQNLLSLLDLTLFTSNGCLLNLLDDFGSLITDVDSEHALRRRTVGLGRVDQYLLRRAHGHDRLLELGHHVRLVPHVVLHHFRAHHMCLEGLRIEVGRVSCVCHRLAWVPSHVLSRHHEHGVLHHLHLTVLAWLRHSHAHIVHHLVWHLSGLLRGLCSRAELVVAVGKGASRLIGAVAVGFKELTLHSLEIVKVTEALLVRLSILRTTFI